MRTIVAIALGILTVFVAGMWVRSLWQRDLLYWGRMEVRHDCGYYKAFRCNEDKATESFEHATLGTSGCELTWWPPVEVELIIPSGTFDKTPFHAVIVTDWLLLLLLAPYPLWRARCWRQQRRMRRRGFPVTPLVP